jgi:hypothetical protein
MRKTAPPPMNEPDESEFERDRLAFDAALEKVESFQEF